MARSRRKKTSLWIALPLWAGVAALVAWGLWQASEFRRTVLADVRQGESRSRKSESADPATEVALGQFNLATAGLVDTPRENDGPRTDGARPGRRFQTATMGAADLISSDPLIAGFADSSMFDPAVSSRELQAEGLRLLDQGHLVEGRAAINAALARSTDEEQTAQLRQLLAGFNRSIFFGSAILPDDALACYIDIQPGDSFLKLGRVHGVTSAFLESINPSLNPRNLKPLTGVKIVRGPFMVHIAKRAGRMDVYAREMYVTSFPVDMPEGNYLPRGEYRVSAGTKLQVGSRVWIGFEGTETSTEDISIGWIYGSAGPRGKSARDRMSGVRMGDAELLQLYNLLVEVRSPIRVEP